jgi:hypothetical protein
MLKGSPLADGKPFCFVKADPASDVTEWEWEECDIPVCGTDCTRDGVDPPDDRLPSCDPVRFGDDKKNKYIHACQGGAAG